MKIITLTDTHLIITNGNVIDKIEIDEKNEVYQQIKSETNEFTENMIQKTSKEISEERINELELYILTKEGLI